MKKRLLSLVLALTMVIGSFNVVFAGTNSKVLIDASYAYATAYVECYAYEGYASTDCYPTSAVTSSSAYVSADLYTSTSVISDSGSDSSSLNVSVELSNYTKEAVKVKSDHSVELDGVTISKNGLTAYR